MCYSNRSFIIICSLLLSFIASNNRNCCQANIQMHHQSSQSEYYVSDTPSQERMDQMKVPNDQTLIVRLPSNTLLKYTAYKDVSILHFRVPPDTRTAYFTFKAFEESKSAFQRKCKPQDVTLHLKASSYPVISPENITFPRNFLNANLRYTTYSLQFQSNEMQQRVTVEGPHIGNWFAIAFVSWTDPNNDRIEQQGLTASCDTLLLAEMSVSRFRPIIINNGQIHNGTLTSYNNEKDMNTNHQNMQRSGKHVDARTPSSSSSLSSSATRDSIATAAGTTIPFNRNDTMKFRRISHAEKLMKGKPFENNSNSTTTNEVIYKFYVPQNIASATARITIATACPECPDIGFHIQANAFPHGKFEKKSYDKNNNQTAANNGSTNANGNGSDNQRVHSSIIKLNQTGQITIEFYVQPDQWHYALFKFVNGSNNDKRDPNTEAVRHAPTKPTINNFAQFFFGTYHQAQASHNPNRRTLRQTNEFDNKEGNELNKFNVKYSFQVDFHGSQSDGKENNNESAESSSLEKNSHNKEGLDNSTAYHTKTNLNDKKNPWRPIKFRNMEFYPLLRQSYREFFMFDFDLIPDENGTVPTVLNLTAGTPAGFAFEIGEISDIGGTLSFAISMKHGQKASNDVKIMPPVSSVTERSGILAEKLIGSPLGIDEHSSKDEESKSLPRSNQTIIVCMNIAEPGIPTWPDKCRFGRRILPASSIVNNTDSNTSTGLIHVPFPESGQWYVTMGLYCHGAETTARVTIIDSVKEFVKKYSKMLDMMRLPCACASDALRYQVCINDEACFKAMNESETLKVKECLMDSKCTTNYIDMTRRFEVHHKFATEQHFALDNCNTSVVFTVSSSPCVAGRCGRFGRCYHYMSGGFVFSTCVCMKGYRGWDCTEDSQVPSNMSILLASLLLTLSNLLFFPSIYMAYRRKYYTEAVIYFFAMFFSIFYHACDSGEDEYSFCLVKIGVLQFCDFYCGLLAIWVTLVAMSHIRQQFVSLLHMFGAILLAFGTELNKQSLWVFLAPALTGICIISVSWGLRCYKTRKWFPSRKYLTLYMPLGMILAMIGLICYAFLQTKQNYHIVHSIWHMVMALSILCLLPSRLSFIPKC